MNKDINMSIKRLFDMYPDLRGMAIVPVPTDDKQYDKMLASLDRLEIKNPQITMFNNDGTLPEKLFGYEFLGDEYVAIPRNFREFSHIINNTNIYTINNINNMRTPKKISKIILRPFQRDFVAKFIDANDCIMNAPCGHGKTIMALHLIHERCVPTLIIVPDKTMAEQWLDRIKTSLVGYEVSVVGSSARSLECVADITICTLPMLTRVTENFLGHFGMVVIDEAHLIGAETYAPQIARIPAKYRLALSATFRRNDEMPTILRAHFGETYTLPNMYAIPAVCRDYVAVPNLGNLVSRSGVAIHALETLKISFEATDNFIVATRIPTSFEISSYLAKIKGTVHEEIILCNPKDVRSKYFKCLSSVLANVDSAFSELPFVNNWAYKTILKCVANGRVPLVISKRKEQLYALYKVLVSKGYDVGLLLSKGDERTTTTSANRQIYLGISQIAKQGLDIERLDTLILLHPAGDPEQDFGRIRREMAEGVKRSPLVIYPHTDIGYYNTIYAKSLTVIKELGVTKFYNNLQTALNEDRAGTN
jgi:hypothetical protein